MKKILKVQNLKYVAAFLMPMIFIMIVNQGLDNDTWFVLAEGRYIANNGVYYTDVLSMHEGLDITVQQYGFAAIFWLVYSVFGPAGLYIMMLLLNLVICYLIYKICMIVSKGNVNLSLLLMVLTDMLLTMGFVTTRPQMVSYCIFLAVVYILELYVRTDKIRCLWWLPLLSVLQINMHASMWWSILLLMGAYIVGSVKVPKLNLKGYRAKPLVLMAVLVFLVGLINPYGIKMITFIFTSYGAAPIVNMVTEMAPFDLRDIFNVFMYVAIVSVLILCIFGDRKELKIRYLLMFFGFLALGLNSVKGMSQLILVMFLPVAAMYNKVRIERVLNAEIGRRAIVTWSGVLAVSVTIGLLIVVPGQIENSPGRVYAEAVDAIDAMAEENGQEKSKLKVYTGYNYGGYLEYRGYKPYLDPRAEVFIGKESKDDDSILEEYWKVRMGRITAEEFLDKYKFDYVYAYERDLGLYDMKDDGYELIYDNDEEKIRVWRRVSTLE